MKELVQVKEVEGEGLIRTSSKSFPYLAEIYKYTPFEIETLLPTNCLNYQGSDKTPELIANLNGSGVKEFMNMAREFSDLRMKILLADNDEAKALIDAFLAA